MPKSSVAKTTKPTSLVAPPERPSLRECLQRGRQGRDVAGLEEAAQQFGGDLRAELEAIEAGSHPLQERPPRAAR